MHAHRFVASVTFAISLVAAHGVAGSPTLGLDDRPSDRNVIASGIRAEGSFRTWLGDQFPLVEGYFQGFDPAPKVGFALKDDHYLLGRYGGGKMENLLAFPVVNGAAKPEENAAEQRLLDGLQQMMVVDWSDLNPEHYEYQFVGQALLGAVPCLVYDVKPRTPEAGIFEGRIYLERRMWNLVRFTGINTRVDALRSTLRDKKSHIRIDSWRINVSESRWAPALAYVEEVPPLGEPDSHIVKGQVRFWGYGKASEYRQQELATLKLWESVSTVASGGQRGCSPQLCQRLFENQAEANVLARLFQARLLGVTGEVERMLDQVMTNLLISNQLALPQPVRCRVLLTTRLEAFMLGNTLILSRGLIDVLPEAGIAIVMAHQLGHLVQGHVRVDTKLGFPEVLRISDAELLAKLRFHHTVQEEQEADQRAIEILKKSPYAPKLPEGELALQALQDDAPQLSHLVEPAFGEHVADVTKAVRNDDVVRNAPDHNLDDPEQVAGLPLGSKLLVNPWNGRLELLHGERIAVPAPYERREFEVTAVVPFLDYFVEKPAEPKPPLTPPRRTTQHTSAPVRRPAASVKEKTL